MIWQVCSIKDSGVDAYLRPFFCAHRNQAIRMFTDEINNPQGDMFKHPEDYSLYHIGQWNDQDGSYGVIQGFDLLVRGQDVKQG